METIDIRQTTTFKNAQEVYNYFEMIGAEKIDSINGRDTYKAYGITLQYNPNRYSIYLPDGIPQDILSLLDNSRFKDFYYENNIFNLEAFIYFYTLLTLGKNNLEMNYQENLRGIKLLSLNKEFNDNNYNFNNRRRPYNDVFEPIVVVEVRNIINKLINIIYPSGNEKAIDNLTDFVDSTSSQAYSENGKIHFKWSFTSFDNTKIECEYHQDDGVFFRIDVYNGEYLDHYLSYHLSRCEETIEYTNDIKSFKRYGINMRRNIICSYDQPRLIKEEDYKNLGVVLNRYINNITATFPYLQQKESSKNRS